MTMQAPSKLERNSLVAQPDGYAGVGAANIGISDYIFLGLAQVADGIVDWGYAPRQRDNQLRLFWPNEPLLASAIGATVERYSAFQWTLSGPPRMVTQMQNMLQSCEGGAGWSALVSKVCTDLFTQDNGAFIEIVRTENSPNAPVITLNHLDAERCVRTGLWDYPVIYTDIDSNKQHKIPWYAVIPLADMPSPIKGARGMQYCALTRILRAAQIMRDVVTYKREKVSGRFTRVVHLVGGVQTKAINDAMTQAQSHADASGLTRYMQAVVLGSLDPNAKVSHEVIEMAALPSDWNEESAMKWYITNMALAFGTDYQDYAPMPGGGIGSGNQAKVSSEKSRGKGPAKFMAMMEHSLNFRGVLPKSVRFEMGEVDIAVEMEKTLLRKERALWLKELVLSGGITTEVMRQILADSGDLDPRYLTFMREEDATSEIQVTATRPPLPKVPDDAETGKAGPSEPPGSKAPAATTAPPNSNALRTKPPSQSQKVVV